MTEKEKLEEAKRLYQTANTDQRYVPERLFPKLKESEDEKKSADKVEPKFKKGDWIIYRDEGCTEILRIIGVTGTNYLCIDISDDYCRNLNINFIDSHNYRLWTIQDAKHGDVLEFGDHRRLVTGILSFVNKTTGKVDVSCLLEGDKFKVGIFYNLDTVKPHPATKEQRDTLFTKMKEAGYMWDVESKQILSLKAEPTAENKHLELKAGKWYICYRAYCCRADHLTVREGERFMCEKDGVVKGFVIKDAEKYFKECNAPAPYEDEQKPKKTSIWKHWKDGIAGGEEGKQIYLIKSGLKYSISSCLGQECDYIELSELDELLREEKQGKWSKEDEYHWMRCIKCLEWCSTPKGNEFYETVKWLESLKQRMKE